MGVSKKTNPWRRSARYVIVVGTIAATTVVGRVSLSGEVGADKIEQDWRNNNVVKAALDIAANESPGIFAGRATGGVGTWILSTDDERISGPVYW